MKEKGWFHLKVLFFWFSSSFFGFFWFPREGLWFFGFKLAKTNFSLVFLVFWSKNHLFLEFLFLVFEGPKPKNQTPSQGNQKKTKKLEENQKNKTFRWNHPFSFKRWFFGFLVLLSFLLLCCQEFPRAEFWLLDFRSFLDLQVCRWFWDYIVKRIFHCILQCFCRYSIFACILLE